MVPHKRLLKKLKWYGFDGKLLLWIEDFLTDREMKVSVNGAYSDWVKVTVCNKVRCWDHFCFCYM